MTAAKPIPIMLLLRLTIPMKMELPASPKPDLNH